MQGSPWNVLLYALLPVTAAIIGGTIATFRRPSPTLRSYIQHTAAGVVFSVVAVELLPDITKVHNAYLEVAIGFVLGVGSMLGLRVLAHRMEEKNGGAGHSGPAKPGLPLGLLVGVGIDILLDGFLIGVSFAAGAKEGTLLTIALTLEMISLGLAVATALGKNGHGRSSAIRTTASLFLLILVGAALGTGLVAVMPDSILEVVLSFGLAALMFLVTEELLVEAHREPESPMATGMFFIGFLIFLLLGMV